MNKHLLALIVLFFVIVGVFYFLRNSSSKVDFSTLPVILPTHTSTPVEALSISYMRSQSYPGSDLKIEETLADGSNYHQYVASYISEGLKIYGLLTVPKQDSQDDNKKYPVIVFNHGYVPPKQYVTTERYVAYVNAFARAGYIVFKPDYRGNGKSDGTAQGSYYSPGYTVDVLNALSSIKKLKDPSSPVGESGRFVVDTNRIGMWGHSMGGNIILRSLAISSDIKAGVIWGGVVGIYDDLMNNWQRRVSYNPPPNEMANRNNNRANLISKYGTPLQNPNFWNSIDPNFNLQYINAPLQLHAGLSDEEVPWQFSEGLDQRLRQAGKEVEFYTYPGADHNISSPSFEIAIQRSVDFFNKYLK